MCDTLSPPPPRSLLSANEGWLTMLFRVDKEIRNVGYIRSMVTKLFMNGGGQGLTNENIKGWRMTKDSMGVVVDVVAEKVQIVHEGGDDDDDDDAAPSSLWTSMMMSAWSTNTDAAAASAAPAAEAKKPHKKHYKVLLGGIEWQDGRGVTLEVAKELPELMELPDRNGFGGGN
ncbi:hypothetical protein HK102_010763, partial [Quaeritorhiza haematococci]